MDGVKVYNVSTGKSAPEWLRSKKAGRPAKDPGELELVQDLEFPAACHRLALSADGNFIFATGIHPPRVRVYELSQLSLKFERHFDTEIVDFQILSEDYAKAAFLGVDRTLHLHARYGAHHTARAPCFGRGLAYDAASADLLVAGSTPEIHRLNLATGAFCAPLATRSPALEALALSPAHGLLAAAGEDGALECWDLRAQRRAGRLEVAAGLGQGEVPLTAVAFDEGRLQVAAGTGDGRVALYDLRAPAPLHVKDHKYGAPIKRIAFHSARAEGPGERRVVSADKHVARIWSTATGANFASLQPPTPGINDVLLWPDQGLLMLACDSPRVQSFFVPALGPAPRWVSHLEGLTEELEAAAQPTLYDDYRFVTRAQLDSVGLGHLVGSNLLRAHLHGFFLHNRLWQRARAVLEPHSYEAYQRERVAARLAEQRASRIARTPHLPKVNAQVAARLLLEKGKAEAAAARAAERGGAEGGPPDGPPPGPAGDILGDERFRAMFEDRAFAVDEAAEEYRQLHPNAGANQREKKLLAEHFEELREASPSGDASGDEGSDDEPAPQPRAKAAGKEPALYAAKSSKAAAAYKARASLARLQRLPLAQRAAEAQSAPAAAK